MFGGTTYPWVIASQSTLEPPTGTVHESFIRTHSALPQTSGITGCAPPAIWDLPFSASISTMAWRSADMTSTDWHPNSTGWSTTGWWLAWVRRSTFTTPLLTTMARGKRVTSRCTTTFESVSAFSGRRYVSRESQTGCLLLVESETMTKPPNKPDARAERRPGRWNRGDTP